MEVFNSSLAYIDGQIDQLVRQKMARNEAGTQTYKDAFVAVSRENPYLFLQRERARLEQSTPNIQYDFVNGMLVNASVLAEPNGTRRLDSPLNLPSGASPDPTELAAQIAMKLVSSEAFVDQLQGEFGLNQIEAALSYLAREQSVARNVPFHEALKLVAHEHPHLDRRRRQLQEEVF